jgi:hypothetical protein
MVERNLKQWRAIIEHVERRHQARYDERLIGEVGDRFGYNHGQLLQSVGKNAASVVQRHDRERESEQLASSIQAAVAQTAALEVGAVGIGAVVVALATARFLDATGIIAAVIIAGYGLFVPPNRRREARREFHEETASLRERLSEVVGRQFDAELNRSVERMRDAIAPYTRFVRTEHARMSESRSSLSDLSGGVDALKDEIAAPGQGRVISPLGALGPADRPGVVAVEVPELGDDVLAHPFRWRLQVVLLAEVPLQVVYQPVPVVAPYLAPARWALHDQLIRHLLSFHRRHCLALRCRSFLAPGPSGWTTMLSFAFFTMTVKGGNDAQRTATPASYRNLTGRQGNGTT